MHERFMQVAGPTDILTFDHGDIAISAETAEENAALYGVSFEEEMELCIVHGLLHLSGFDDKCEAHVMSMRKAEKDVLSICRLKFPVAPNQINRDKLMHPPTKKKLTIFTAMVAIGSCLSVAPAQDSNAPIDAKGILSALSAIKTKQADAEKGQKTNVFQQIQAASADNSSAMAFYMEAIRATKFQGESREQTQFHDWKKKQADELKKPAFQTAVRLHLAYLVLTLERANGMTTKQMLSQILSYMAQAQSVPESLFDPMMQHEIGGSIFVNWYQISSWVQQAEEWEAKPGNIDGIWEKVILPEFRAQKDPASWIIGITNWPRNQIGPRNPAARSTPKNSTRSAARL